MGLFQKTPPRTKSTVDVVERNDEWWREYGELQREDGGCGRDKREGREKKGGREQ